MSLRIWLPLNGNLDNKGLNGSIATLTGAVAVNNSGKFGKCYQFGTSTGRITLPKETMNDLTECSVSFWVNILGWQTNWDTFFQAGLGTSPWNSYIFGVLRNQGNFLCFTIGDTSTSSQGSYKSSDLTLETWYHLTFIYKEGHCLIYINGELDKDYTTTIVPDFSKINYVSIGQLGNASNYQTNCKINDFRLYDHALSLKEVKEISKGLILHYPLADKYIENTTNLITTEDCLSATCYNGAISKYSYGTNTDMYKEVTTFQGKKGTKVYNQTNGTGMYPYVYINNMYTSDGTNSPSYKTLSFDYYTTISTSICPYKLGSGNGIATYIVTNNETKTGTGTNQVIIPVKPNMWNHIEVTFHGTTEADAQWGYIQNQPSHTSDISNFWFFANMQLEEKDHATGYIGTNGTTTDYTVYDTSGFENNSTAENLVVKNSNNIPNILSSTTVTIKNWTNINPDCMVLSTRESNPNKNRVFVKQALSGKWENVYSPAITVTANQEYTLSCYYRVYDPYTFTSSYGDFGLTVMTSVPSNANPINSTIARIPFPNTITGSTKGSVTFTPTVGTIYLNICGGSITDGQLGKTFDIDYIQLEEGDTTTEYVEPVRYNRFTVFNGSNSHILGESISSEALTASCWIYPKNTSSQICFIDYKSGLSFGMWNNQYIICSCKSNLNQAYPLTNLILNKWNHVVVQKNLTDSKMDLYINGAKQTVLRTDYWSANMTDKLTIGARMNGTNPFNGYMSDFRIYASALTQNQILELYRNTTSVDKDNNFYSYKYDEMYQGNEIEYLHDLTKLNSGTISQDKDGLYLDQNVWVTHDYIPIDPTNKTYKYDILFSNDGGNLLYIGWERYDIDKTSRSNNACVYVLASSAERNYYRIRGTVNLSTDSVNPCAFIKLRILNKWSGSESDTNGTATIHYLSLKEYTNTTTQDMTPLNINKQGIVNTTEILEKDIGVSVSNVYELNSHNFYEY